MNATNAVVGVASVGYRPLSCVNGVVGEIAGGSVSCQDFNAVELAFASDRSRWRSAICSSSLVGPVPGGIGRRVGSPVGSRFLGDPSRDAVDSRVFRKIAAGHPSA